jgi:TRAP-type mannitol/chloroaromatic compound transport system substrate-binding protein
MDRRSFIRSAGLAGAGAATTALAAPAIAQERIEWSMVTTWPAGFPGLGVGAARFAERVGQMSDGRLTIQVYGAILLVGVALLVTAACAGLYRRRLGGVTGDAIGATTVLVELSVIATVVAAAR